MHAFWCALIVACFIGFLGSVFLVEVHPYVHDWFCTYWQSVYSKKVPCNIRSSETVPTRDCQHPGKQRHQVCSAPGLLGTWSARHLVCSAPGLLGTRSARHQVCSAPGLLGTWSARHQVCSAPGLLGTWSAWHLVCLARSG